MNIGEIIRMSLKSIRVNKVRAMLTMLGVIIGVASVILLVSIVQGLEKTIRNELNSFGANLIIIFPGERSGGRGPGGVVANKLKFSDGDLIETRVPEVTDLIASVQGIGPVKYKNKEVENTTIQGVTGNYFTALNIGITEGKAFSKFEKGNVALIGPTVKEELFKNVSPIGKDIVVKERRFKVIGVMEERGSLFGQDQDNVLYLPLGPSRSLLGVDRPNWFFLKADEAADIDVVKNKIEKLLLKDLEPEDFTVSTQEETLELVATILGVLSAGLGGIAAISLIVGGVGIMNIMLVSVSERTREIGLRKALGARRKDVLLQFLIEAVVLSVMGGLLGVIVGMGLSLILDRFIATQINYFFVFLSFGVSAIIGIVFGLAPAIRASKLSPIEALRYE